MRAFLPHFELMAVGRNCEILAMRRCWKRQSMGAPTHWSHSTCGTLGPCLRAVAEEEGFEPPRPFRV
jgi:hypothetical protein